MRISFILLTAAFLSSCSLFKNSKASSEDASSHARETFNTQQRRSDHRSMLQTSDVWSSDSSETTNIIEIVPAGVFRYLGDDGFSVEAKHVRILTRQLTGKSVVSSTSEAENAGSEMLASTADAKENSATFSKKEKKARPPMSMVLIVGSAIFIVILCCMYRFRNLV